ncbi:discoidin domain-containing protein [Coraliomargarita algicola]|uniref:Discoidin domain-containing protein n=1 Tax=Coraliomargarita algicola TaxID=3092156 RepID=A0ABZ0RLZ8_9BACT|nr:discoidin domain-containing protein [Coraliomargarita sp. J2-16]WPJ97245.1 discoidin domain-containing protein [Coraliomargarita sp. J2-16]
MLNLIRKSTSLAACLTAAAFAPIIAEGQIEAPSISSSYQIDGSFAEPFWKQLEWQDSFHALKSDAPAPDATRFTVAVTDDALLIGIIADVDKGLIANKANQTTVANPTLVGYGKEPGLELFIAPSADSDQYGQWYVTTAGLANDIWRKAGTGAGGLTSWRSQAEVASQVNDGKWFVEMAIPLAAFKYTPESAEQDWRIMLGRVHPRKDGRPVSYSTHAPLSDNFHELANYVPLHMEHSGLEDFLWMIRPVNDGKVIQGTNGMLEYQLEIVADRMEKEGAEFRDVQIDGTLETTQGAVEASSMVALKSSRSSMVNLTFPLSAKDAPKTGTLKLSLAAKELPNRALALHVQDVPLDFKPISIHVTQPAYRNSIYATEDIDAIEAAVSLAVAPEDLRNARLTAALYASGNDQPVAIQELDMTNLQSTVRLELEQKLAVGSYQLQVSVQKPDGTQWQTKELIRSLPAAPYDEWRIDADKVLLRNGEPFLPYGWFGWKTEADPAIEGINTVHVYHLPNQGIEKTLAFMDRMAEEGVVCLTDPWPAALYRKNQKQPMSVAEEEQLRQYVRRLRDHKALLAYYIYDEPEFVPVLPERLNRAYEIIQEEDPYHPCIILNMQFDAIDRYASAADIIMPDPYPSFRENMGPISGIVKVAKHLKEAKRASEGRQAIWVTPQAFEWDAQTPAARAPNFLELRNQQIQGIVTGSKGFIWWIYGRQLNDKNLELGMPFLAREAQLLKSAILSPDVEEELQISADDTSHLHSAVRKVGEHTYIFVVNTSPESMGAVNFHLPSLGTTALQVVSEKRNLRVGNGKWRDTFEGYAAHVYTTDPHYEFGQTVLAVQRRIDESLATLGKPGNLAFRGLGAEIETSTHYEFGTYPKRLNDGYDGRWWQAQQGKDPAWIQINFPSATEVGRIVAVTNARSFEVQVKDTRGWKTVYRGEKPAHTPVVAPFTPQTTDTVRLLIHSAGNRSSERITAQEIEAYAN